MVKKMVWGVLLAVAAACQGAEAPPVLANSDDEIQGGKADTGDAAVGLLWFQGGGFCSGTLVAPNIVLTAGHCVAHPIEGFYLGSGSAGNGGGVPAKLARHAVSDQVAHPSFGGVYSCPAPSFDVALVRLAQPVSGVKPARMRGAAPAKGTVCTGVGFGLHTDANGADSYGLKRRGSETIDTLTQTALGVAMGNGIADYGDSGGPLLCHGAIAGVTSCKDDGQWPTHKHGYYARIDSVGDWLAATISGWSR